MGSVFVLLGVTVAAHKEVVNVYGWDIQIKKKKTTSISCKGLLMPVLRPQICKLQKEERKNGECAWVINDMNVLL